MAVTANVPTFIILIHVFIFNDRIEVIPTGSIDMDRAFSLANPHCINKAIKYIVDEINRLLHAITGAKKNS